MTTDKQGRTVTYVLYTKRHEFSPRLRFVWEVKEVSSDYDQLKRWLMFSGTQIRRIKGKAE